MTYQVQTTYRSVQACSPAGCSIQYVPVASPQYAAPPAKTTPQAVPPLPTGQTSYDPGAPPIAAELLGYDGPPIAPMFESPPSDAAPPPPVVARVVYGDRHGVFGIINRIRAQRGLRQLAYDQALAAAADQNNAGQLRAGYSSHHTNPGAYQVAYVGPTTADAAVNGWLASPSHAGVLLNPNVTTIGVAMTGNAWTANLR